MAKIEKQPKTKRGIFGKLSGDNEVVIFQKNGVIRARRLKSTKSGTTK